MNPESLAAHFLLNGWHPWLMLTEHLRLDARDLCAMAYNEDVPLTAVYMEIQEPHALLLHYKDEEA